MPVTTMRLVMLLFVFVVHGRTAQLVQVIFEGDRAVIPDHRVPFGDDAGVFNALVMGGRAVVVSMVDMEAPLAVLPQGAVPFGVVGLLVATFVTIGEWGMFALVGLVFRNSACLQTIFSFDVAPLIFWWPLSSEDVG